VPAAGATAGSGDVLVVLEKDAARARLVDPATGATTATLPTGPFPHEVVVSPDGRTAVVADYGAQEPGRTLTVLDLAARRVTRTVDLGEYRRPHGIVWLPGPGARVVVTAEQSQAVLVVDVGAGRVERAIPTGQRGTHMVAVSADGRRAWTANIGSGSVTLVDLARGDTVRTRVTGRGPEAIDVSPDGREVWAADRDLDRITVLDAATLDSLGSVPTGRFPNRLKFTPDGRHVLVSNAAAGTLGVYDARGRRLAATVALGEGPAAAPNPMNPSGRSAVPLGIQLAPRGGRAWVALNAAGALAEVELPAGGADRARVARRVPAGTGRTGWPTRRRRVRQAPRRQPRQHPSDGRRDLRVGRPGPQLHLRQLALEAGAHPRRHPVDRPRVVHEVVVAHVDAQHRGAAEAGHPPLVSRVERRPVRRVGLALAGPSAAGDAADDHVEGPVQVDQQPRRARRGRVEAARRRALVERPLAAVHHAVLPQPAREHLGVLVPGAVEHPAAALAADAPHALEAGGEEVQLEAQRVRPARLRAAGVVGLEPRVVGHALGGELEAEAGARARVSVLLPAPTMPATPISTEGWRRTRAGGNGEHGREGSHPAVPRATRARASRRARSRLSAPGRVRARSRRRGPGRPPPAHPPTGGSRGTSTARRRRRRPAGRAGRPRPRGAGTAA
jgi:DNA-binding beta-propeller fold protein YncE